MLLGQCYIRHTFISLFSVTKTADFLVVRERGAEIVRMKEQAGLEVLESDH